MERSFREDQEIYVKWCSTRWILDQQKACVHDFEKRSYLVQVIWPTSSKDHAAEPLNDSIPNLWPEHSCEEVKLLRYLF